jgi:predicted transport protein
METLLGVRFLASEYSTGPRHGGRIDSLGIDENGAPVIVEYKRSLNENVINQGLYYLDWLFDHRDAFTLLVRDQIGREVADAIEWENARLLCIAGDFTKYDTYSVQQIPRNIELIRYRRYDDQILLLELVNATEGQAPDTKGGEKSPTRAGRRPDETVTDRLAKASPELKDLFESLKSFALALGDDVQVKTLKHYFAFKKIKNFLCVEVHPGDEKLRTYVNVDPDTVELEEGFTRDLRNVGHLGTGELEILIASEDDLLRAQDLITKSYEKS